MWQRTVAQNGGVDAPIADPDTRPAVHRGDVHQPPHGGRPRLRTRWRSGWSSSLAQQPGYLGHEAVRDERRGITVSYWVDAEAAAAWKQVAEHLVAQERGREAWYDDYTVRVATVERDYRDAVTSNTGSRGPLQG